MYHDDFSFWQSFAVIVFTFMPFLVLAFVSGDVIWMVIQCSIVIFLIGASAWLSRLDSREG